jgi:GGDEF domain-containing protein
MLLEGIARTALAYDREEYGQFRGTLQKLAETLEISDDAGELVGVADAVSQALETYNRGAQRVQAAQTVELRCMIEMLSQTLVSLADAGSQSIRNLQLIRNQVDSARQLDDIRILRARLGDSLKAISDEVRLQRDRNSKMLQKGEDAASVASGHLAEHDIDRVSGLPSMPKATSEITARLGADSPYYAAVFAVERVDSINLRYGYAAGDQLLQAFARYLMSNLPPADEIFRWRGPTFVVLLERTCPADGVRAELARFASTRPELSMDVEGRPIKLPMSFAWALVPLATCQIADHACQQIDRFVADHWGGKK